jgi:hypothetical protein
MKQIDNLLQIEHGKRYFIMCSTRGRISTGIVTADVQKTGAPIVAHINVTFAMDPKNSDLTPGKIEDIIYMAEIDE